MCKGKFQLMSTITQEKFEHIKEKYGHYASWAVWSEEGSTPKSNMCTAIFNDSEIVDTLHTKYILVALNISRAIEIPLGNFHPNYSAATDYKTRYALKGTPLWGSYMTDIIKDFEELASGKMMKYLKENPEFEQSNVKTFLNELNFIGADNPTLVAIGNDSYKILTRNLGSKFEVKKIPHYASYISKETFRNQVLTILEP